MDYNKVKEQRFRSNRHDFNKYKVPHHRKIRNTMYWKIS